MKLTNNTHHQADQHDAPGIDDLKMATEELSDEFLEFVVGALPRDKGGDDRSKGCTEVGGGIWDPILLSSDI